MAKDKMVTLFRGTSLSTVVFLIFLVLKLAEIGPVATWSWWWVTSPLWIPWLVVLGIFSLIGFGLLIMFIFALIIKY